MDLLYLFLLMPVSIFIINIILNIYKLDNNCIQYKILNGIKIALYIFLAIFITYMTFECSNIGIFEVMAIIGAISLLISSVSTLIINLIYKIMKKKSISQNIILTILYIAFLIFSFIYIYLSIYLSYKF